MTPTHVTASSKRYRYYLCTAAHTLRGHACPAPSIAALPVEQVILEQLKVLSQDCAPVQALLDYGWPSLAVAQQRRVLRLLVERVDYDGNAGKLVLALNPRGPQLLAEAFPGALP
jgi:hypothetical protein